MAGDRNTMLGLLLAKVENPEGTDAAPTAASNAIQILEPLEAGGEHVFKHARDKLVVGTAIQASPPLTPKGLVGTWSGNVHVRGTRAGTAYAANNLPELDPYWQAAGFAATLTTTGGSEKVVYTPAATGLKSITEYYYIDGRLKKLLGAKADIDLSFDAGGPIVAALKRTGLYQTPTDVAMPASPVFGAAIAPVADNIAFTIDGYSAGILRKFSCKLGNGIKQRPNANVTGGLSPHKIRERKIVVEVTLEDELASTKDFESMRDTRASFAMSWFLNASQYNRFRFTAPNGIIESVKPGNDNGTEISTLTIGVFDSTPGANDAVAFSHE